MDPKRHVQLRDEMLLPSILSASSKVCFSLRIGAPMLYA
jgi:hypothetical protein